MLQHKVILGSEEWCSFPELGIPTIKARVDSGAKTSAMHAINIAPFIKNDANWVKFDINPIQNNIKTIINLRFFDRNDDQEELSNLPLNLVNHPLKSWRIKPKEIAAVLYDIEQAQKKGGVLVHCYHGADRTGLIIGMYRIVNQGWSIDEAKREMMEGPYGFHTVWRNIPKMYNQDTVNQVRLELERLRAAK